MNGFSNIKAILFIMLAMSVMFAGCSQDEDIEGQAVNVMLGLGTRNYDESTLPSRAMYSDARNSYHAFGTLPNEAGLAPSIQVYLGKADGTLNQGFFTHVEDYTWRSFVTMVPNETYYVYGFMPREAATGTITAIDGDYSKGATLTLTGLSTASTSDVCIIVGAKKELSETFDIASPLTTLVSPGAHAFTASASEGSNFLYVLMDHIYTKLDLQFKVNAGSNYTTLRAIKLKKVTMRTDVANVTITIRNDGSKLTDIRYDKGESSPIPITLFDVENDDDDSNNDGVEITPGGISVPAFFTPIESNTTKTLIFESTYDVYLRDSAGNTTDFITRRNCTAVNTWELTTSTGHGIGAGQQVTVKATVEPTYLYVLSDPDLDNPTIKIE